MSALSLTSLQIWQRLLWFPEMHTVGHSNINACRAGSLSGWLQQNLTSNHRKKGKLFTITRIDKNLLRPLFSIISLMKCFLQERLHTTTEQNIFALKELCYVCLRHILVTALTRGFMVENCASGGLWKQKWLLLLLVKLHCYLDQFDTSTDGNSIQL